MDQAPPPAVPIAGIIQAEQQMAEADYEARKIAEEAIRRAQQPPPQPR
jgi:hypothetical protein